MKNFIYILLTVYFVFVNHLFAQNVDLLGQLDPHPNTAYADIWGYAANGREYALMGATGGTSIIDITDPASPVEVDFILGPLAPPYEWRDIKTHLNYAYVITEGTGSGQGLQIIDLSNLPASASLVNTVDTWFSRAHNIFIDNGYAYVIGTNGGGGMHILDLSDPVNPVQTAYYATSDYIHDVYVWNDTVVACAADSYDLVDVSDKSNPQLISLSSTIPGIYAHSGWMTEDKRYFLATEEFNIRDLIVYDLQDRSTWDLVVPSWQMSGNSPIHNIFVLGDYAHISYYKDGYVVLDISDPTVPTLAGHYDTFPGTGGNYDGAWGCYPYLPSGNVIISDMSTGLYVLDFLGGGTTSANDIIKAPVEFELKQNYPNPFNPSTKIKYAISEQSFVTLKIYDVLGNEVVTLVNKDKPAGNYEVTFNAGDLPSGIYLARLTGGNNTRIIKMSLTK
jgi:choice-of-anchor B domain-containing protein